MATGLVTLNPSDALNATLSGGNLVATGGASVPPGAVRGINAQSSGLYYFETVLTGSAGVGVGIAGSATALSAVGSGTNAALIYVTYYTQGPVFVNGTLTGQIGELGSGDTVSVVLDVNRSLVYFRDSSVDPTYGWNAFPSWNNGGNTNPNLPALGTGYFSYTVFGPGTVPVFPMWFFMPNRAVAQQVTLVTASASMYGAVPSGFSTLGASAWDPAKTVGSGVVLSNSNMTANVPAGVTQTITVIGTVSMTTGKYYFEIQVDAIDTSAGANNNNGPGISDGGNVHTVTIRGNQSVNQDQTALGAIGADSFQYYSGMRIAIAVDLTAGHIWYRNLGAQPGAGIGGISIAGLTGPFLPAGVFGEVGEQVGFAFAASSFVGNVPAGVSVWPGLYQPDVFSPPNISLPIIRERVTDTRTSSVASGKRWRSPLRQYPTIRWTLTFEALTSLSSYQGLVAQGWQYLEGFIVDQSGPFQEFLFQDIYTPDYQISAGLIGTGDGVTTNFTISRALRNTHEPVGWVNAADVSNVSVGGVSQASGWSIVAPNILSFASAPASGKAITITCNFYWRCTFTEDTATMDAFMIDLLDFKELKFESLPSATAANL